MANRNKSQTTKRPRLWHVSNGGGGLPTDVPRISLGAECYDPLGLEWHEIRLHGMYWEPRSGAVIIFNGETYKRAESVEMVGDIIWQIAADRRLQRFHAGDGRLLASHWLLIDVLSAGFILPAKIAWDSVVAQRAVGWEPPAMMFPLK